MQNEELKKFYDQRKSRISSYKEEYQKFKAVSQKLTELDYEYNFDMLGRPIIQLPQDIIACQEIIWEVKPDLIIETGIAHGGSLIFSAAMLALLDFCDAATEGELLNTQKSKRQVLGIDIDIRPHNRKLIEEHPLHCMINLIQGSSIDPSIVRQVSEIAQKHKKILVFLDSNHTHDHVLQELRSYSQLVSTGSYCIVFDTIIDDLPKSLIKNRPWETGNSPKTAVHEFLRETNNFKIDTDIEQKLLMTVAPSGYLKRIDTNV